MQVINPATEQVIQELTEDNPSSLHEKFALLQKGQRAWAGKSLAERIDIIRHFSSLLEKNIEELAQILSSEVGKPLQQSRNEINGARGRIQWLCDHASTYLQEEIMSDSPGMQEKIVYEPLGVICNISAWNYPYLVGTNVFVPALLAGNSVMYKPSEYASLTGLAIAKYFYQAGVPETAFQTAIGAGSVGAQLLELPFQGYYFTGSYQTGQKIYSQVAPKMVPVQCELGGKDPVYITDDISDINAVAAGTADGAFYNNGQSCCSVERIYVHEKVYDAYVAAFVQEVKSWKMGDPTEEGVYLGPLSRKAQVAILEKQVKQALDLGATLACGGKAVDRKGYYFEPTVLVNVNHQMDVMKEESFGPIIGIQKVKDDAEAIALMKDTAYGLTSSVYSIHENRAQEILSQMDSGSAYWNCCDRVSAALPWSGRKHSGFGATLSHQGIRAFTKTKSYHLRQP
ncbi:aldehyde dehydrogenase family protein [Aquirufa rosea]|uniref:Aldehyde dehydrogenase family protein n=1 Tax=Aquirufa rosea TaxID=2509241 RepID=A0A4Q1C0Q2_9BACT|nr:aldehyde dehydrogenase family protein [Aquirufa rosea]RXK49927.1 aldehyde dehydrogenase family protein [Aquirufa rosea]